MWLFLIFFIYIFSNLRYLFIILFCVAFIIILVGVVVLSTIYLPIIKILILTSLIF